MIKTKIFQVKPDTIKTINNFLSKSSIGTVMKQEFANDDKNRLYLIVTIHEKEE
jgi:hypothetical protein